MTTHRSRILALAAVAALATAAPAWAQDPAPAGEPAQGQRPAVTNVLDKAVSSNRLATARMWTELHDAAQLLRAEAADENWDAALKRVREVRARIDRMAASGVVERDARLIVAELRPFAVDIEERITHGRGGGVLRGVDTLLAHVARTQNELLAAGHMERMGGGAGPGRLPKMPEVKVYPKGQAPGNERNQIDEWREPID